MLVKGFGFGVLGCGFRFKGLGLSSLVLVFSVGG